MQQYADIYSLQRNSTCFGCHAPSSGVLKTVSATSGVCHGTGTVTSFHRGLIRSPDPATVEGSNGTITMTYTRGSRYSF